jgi:hypothetical protein
MEKHTGGCHCGKIRYEADLDLSEPVIECDCSHCAMKGLLLQFTTPEHFRTLAGEEDAKVYRFNKLVIDHVLCPECGVEPFGKRKNPDGSPAVAVNVRTIDGIDLAALTRMPYAGKDF